MNNWLVAFRLPTAIYCLTLSHILNLIAISQHIQRSRHRALWLALLLVVQLFSVFAEDIRPDLQLEASAMAQDVLLADAHDEHHHLRSESTSTADAISAASAQYAENHDRDHDPASTQSNTATASAFNTHADDQAVCDQCPACHGHCHHLALTQLALPVLDQIALNSASSLLIDYSPTHFEFYRPPNV